jgi:hypothetical protein
VESKTTQTSKTIARPVMTPRSEAAAKAAAAAASAYAPGAATVGRATAPRQGKTPVGTYVADSFAGDATMTSGGTPVLAQDGEPAGLARVTLAMRRSEGKLPPAPRRLVGLCAWAAAVGIIGVLIGIWAAIAFLAGAPGWFLPVAGLIGVAGVGFTMGAFVTARQRQIPWALLSAATLCLIIATIVTASV